MSNGLNPDQDRHSVGPDLNPNHLQRLSADDKVAASKERVKTLFFRKNKTSCGIVICPDYQTQVLESKMVFFPLLGLKKIFDVNIPKTKSKS